MADRDDPHRDAAHDGPAATGAEAPLDPAVYAELRQIARRFMRRERPEHTLQPTALVHEALLRLPASKTLPRSDDPAFVSLAARAMRNVLVDHARRRRAQKRSTPHGYTLGDGVTAPHADATLEVLAIDDALRQLATLAPRAARVVELRFFAGLEVEEVATALAISCATVKRDWTLARAWLRRELDGDASSAHAAALIE